MMVEVSIHDLQVGEQYIYKDGTNECLVEVLKKNTSNSETAVTLIVKNSYKGMFVKDVNLTCVSNRAYFTLQVWKFYKDNPVIPIEED